MHTLTIRTRFTFGDRVCWENSGGRRATTGTVVGIYVVSRRHRFEIEYEIEYDDDPYVHFSHRESALAPLAPPAGSAVSQSRKRPASISVEASSPLTSPETRSNGILSHRGHRRRRHRAGGD